MKMKHIKLQLILNKAGKTSTVMMQSVTDMKNCSKFKFKFSQNLQHRLFTPQKLHIFTLTNNSESESQS